jgi:hypothetical protein
MSLSKRIVREKSAKVDFLRPENAGQAGILWRLTGLGRLFKIRPGGLNRRLLPRIFPGRKMVKLLSSGEVKTWKN